MKKKTVEKKRVEATSPGEMLSNFPVFIVGVFNLHQT